MCILDFPYGIYDLTFLNLSEVRVFVILVLLFSPLFFPLTFYIILTVTANVSYLCPCRYFVFLWT